MTAIIDLLPVLVPIFCVRGGGQSETQWDFPSKFVGSLTLFRGYNRTLDAVFIAAVGVFIVLSFLWSKRTQAVGSTLFVGAGCVAMFLIGPTILFGGSPADARFLPAAAPLIALSFDFAFPPRKALVLLGIFLALVGFRIGMIGYYWHRIDAELREQVALFADIPVQAKVYPMVKIADAPDEKKRELPLFHAICYAVVDRQVYTPTLVAFAGHNPLRYKESPPRVKLHLDPAPFLSADQVDWELILATHEYLWCWHVPADYRRILDQRCTLVAEKEGGSIWRVRNR